jgi:hypothetical protein
MAGILEGANIASSNLLNYTERAGMHKEVSKAYHPKGSKLERKARKAFLKLGAKQYGNGE